MSVYHHLKLLLIIIQFSFSINLIIMLQNKITQFVFFGLTFFKLLPMIELSFVIVDFLEKID